MRRTHALHALSLLLCSLIITGCMQQRLDDPIVLVGPYAQTQRWAVAPLVNESGVSIVQGDRIADLLTEQAEQVEDITTIPVNRVLAAMDQLGYGTVQTPADARTLMHVLDLDGLIVGTVTAYDPYRPPKLGLALELHVREQPDGQAMIDPNALIKSTTGEPAAGTLGMLNPVAQASGVFDASNHETLTQLAVYTHGRDEPASAYGKDIYLVRMELYTQFVCFQLLHDLLREEWMRMRTAAATNDES
jgi:hypothetical protein